MMWSFARKLLVEQRILAFFGRDFMRENHHPMRPARLAGGRHGVSSGATLRWLAAAGCGALLALACTTPAWAWGPKGHAIVADLAWTRMTPAARAAARALWPALPDATTPPRSLAGIASWADDLRDTDPALFRRTRRLHFVNFHSADCDYDPPRDCRDGECAVAGIEKYSAILANRNNPPAARAQALAFVVHLVGDVHQPLHAGYRHDAGGNDYQVQWRGNGTNLHRIWDSGMLDTRHRSAARYAAYLKHSTAAIDRGGTPAEWAEESCRIDRDGGVYPRGHVIDDAYVARELPVAERRLRQAGARLAALLNRDLANG